jgi:dsRNA-specific ribonuclease
MMRLHDTEASLPTLAQGRTGRLALLDEALTHASACAAAPAGAPAAAAPAYQRLEFLGDAALDYLVMRALFSRTARANCSKPLSAGQLSELRAAAVNNETLAGRAAALRLGAHLRHGSTALHADVLRYATARQEAAQQGHAAYGSGDAPAPKVLADAFEAVVGAVLLDSGLDLDALWHVLAPLMALDDVVAAGAVAGGARHPVAALYEACAAEEVTCALVVVVPPATATEAACDQQQQRRPGAPDVVVRALVGGVVAAQAAGRSTRTAKQHAAEAALARWPAALAEAAAAAAEPAMA